MIKKKGKKADKAAKKIGKKKSGKKSSRAKIKKECNPAEVRKQISRIVESRATAMVSAVADEGQKGQLAPVKYLLEVASIFPPANDGEHATEEEDCLAKMLLDKITVPRKPAVEDDGDEEEAGVGAEPDAGTKTETAQKNDGAAVAGDAAPVQVRG